MILNSHPDIQEAAVVGIPQPGRPENDMPLAFVVRRSETLTKIGVENYISSSVSDFKRLRGGVIFVDSIEKVSLHRPC
jgi:4-coumarate--CoA ligase